VILATDGDFNEGETSEEELEKLVAEYKDWGIYLTCLGVGMGNYKDSKLEALAKKGMGILPIWMMSRRLRRCWWRNLRRPSMRWQMMPI
jgi:hypothetical protein